MRRRSLFWPLALVLSLATGLTLLRASELLTTAPLSTSAGISPNVVTSNAGVVRRFYAAVNGFVGDGDVAALDAVIAPDFLDHVNRPGLTSTREGLLTYLGALRSTFPALRLTVTSAVADPAGGRVLAQVRLDGTTAAGARHLLPPADSLWGPFDAFRVAGGQVLEHWGSRDPPLVPQTLARASLALPAGPEHAFTLDRLSFPPRAIRTVQSLPAPRLDYVESGALDIAVAPQSAAAPAVWGPHRPDSPVTIAAGTRTSAKAGDLLVLPRGTAYAIRNDSRDPSAVLEMDATDGGAYPSSDLWSDEIFDQDPAAAVAIQTLAGGRPTTTVGGSAMVALQRVAVAPGALLPLPAGATLLTVASGRLALETSTGTSWVLRAVGEVSEADTVATLVAGDGAQLDAGSDAILRNAGSTPLMLLMVTIHPDLSAAGSPAAGEPPQE